MAPLDHCAAGFGLIWCADIALDAFDPVAVDMPAAVTVRRVEALAHRMPLRTLHRGAIHADGFRFGWNDEIVFDMIGGDRIEYLPGADWRGALPWAFYGTVAALTLAWRGALPFHACAVEIDGRAVLVAGPPGAGKSSLTAGLLDLGARFFADDLSVVRTMEEGFEVVRGRPAMRQHRDTAARIPAVSRAPVVDDPRDKWLVRPRARSDAMTLPLGGILLLTTAPLESGGVAKLGQLSRHMFRPRWLAALPGYPAQRRALMALAGAVPVAGFPAIDTFDPAGQRARAEQAMAVIAAMLR